MLWRTTGLLFAVLCVSCEPDSPSASSVHAAVPQLDFFDQPAKVIFRACESDQGFGLSGIAFRSLPSFPNSVRVQSPAIPAVGEIEVGLGMSLIVDGAVLMQCGHNSTRGHGSLVAEIVIESEFPVVVCFDGLVNFQLEGYPPGTVLEPGMYRLELKGESDGFDCADELERIRTKEEAC